MKQSKSSAELVKHQYFKLNRIVIISFFIAIAMFSCSILKIYATTYNNATDWLKDAVYGIDGPSPPVNIPSVVVGNFNNQMLAWDVEAAVDIAEQAGAGYMLIGVTHVDGYFIAPNPTFDSYTGYQPGERCSTRDLIEEYYQELNSRGMKLMLYWTGDGPRKDTKAATALGWQDGAITNDFKTKWLEITKYYSQKYGGKVAGWWVDGCYLNSGYNQAVLTEFEAALKFGNPNAIVCFNDHAGIQSLENRFGISDYTAGESYGLNMACTSRWVNQIQWHRYLPLFEFCNKGSAYAMNDLIDYLRQCRDNGGVVTLGTASTGAVVMPFDPVQLEMLKAIKRGVRNNENLNSSFNGTTRVQAENCNSLLKNGNSNPNITPSASLQTITSNEYGVKFETKTGLISKYFYNGGISSNMILWSAYKNVGVASGTYGFVAAVKAPTTSAEYLYKLQVRVGGVDGTLLGSIDNVGYVDWFRFVDAAHPVTVLDSQDLPAGYSLKTFSISDLTIGSKDIYLVNVLKEGKPQIGDAFTKINAVDYSAVINGEVATLTTQIGEKTVGNFDTNDILVYRGVNFKTGTTGFEGYVTVDTAFAGQKLDIYIDAPNTTLGKKIGSLTVQNTFGWENYTVQYTSVQNVTGVHDLYFVGNGTTSGICGFNWFRFIPADVVFLDKTGWEATAFGYYTPLNCAPSKMIDKRYGASYRWASATFQAPGQWIKIDMKAAKSVKKIVMNTPLSDNGYARGYNVYLSMDGVNWGSAVATGNGIAGDTIIQLSNAQTARYLKIEQTQTWTGGWWNIHELDVYGASVNVDSIAFHHIEGQTQTDISQSGLIAGLTRITAQISNNTNSNTSSTLIVGLYKNNAQQLVQVVKSTETDIQSGINSLATDITVPDDITTVNYVIKVFVWDGITVINPLSKIATFTKK